jgi:predicted transcriptional regulator
VNVNARKARALIPLVLAGLSTVTLAACQTTAAAIDTYCAEARIIPYDPVLVNDNELEADLDAANARYTARCL